jgi:hypothetical protein
MIMTITIKKRNRDDRTIRSINVMYVTAQILGYNLVTPTTLKTNLHSNKVALNDVGKYRNTAQITKSHTCSTC